MSGSRMKVVITDMYKYDRLSIHVDLSVSSLNPSSQAHT